MVFSTSIQEADVRDALAKSDGLLRKKDAEIKRLKLRIRHLERALFGRKSERVVDDGSQLLFDALLKELDEMEGEESEILPPEPQRESRRRASRPRRNLHELIPDDLPREETVLDLPVCERTCLVTGKPMVCIGEERTEKLAWKPGFWYVKVFIRPRYAAPANPRQGVLVRPAPDYAVPGGHYDESFMAAVMFNKCVMHLPLYRQEEQLKAAGIKVSRQTLSRLYIRGAEVIRPVFERIKQDILGRDVLFTDDTTLPMLMPGTGKTLTGRMWVYVGGGNGPPYRVFEFSRDRKSRRPLTFLKNYQGYVHADAYSGYAKLFKRDDVHECSCWMHVRRGFHKAEDGPPELRRRILYLIKCMYRYERAIKNETPQKILRVRNEKIAPLIDAIFKETRQALLHPQFSARSQMGKAIAYLHNRGKSLSTFLADHRLCPDNGESERAIRPLTIGRKNWLFAGSDKAAQATAMILSITQSCRQLNINPFEYLTDILRRINGHNASKVHELMPHCWKPAKNYYL